MDVVFQLLDISYEVEGGSPVIILWGRTEENSRIVIRYRGFHPYFYAVLEDPSKSEDVTRRIKALSESSSPIINVEPVKMKYIGRPIEALKITTLIPARVRAYREKVKKLEGVLDVLEADIRFSMRFLLDKNLYPMRWYKIKDVKEVNSGAYRVKHVYEASNTEIIELEEYSNKDPLEDLRILAFDIEVYSERGSPDPRKDPIVIIGYITSDMEKPELIIMKGKSDHVVIQKFVEIIRDYDPDIIVGYNQNGFDWLYLIERAKIHGIKLDVGRRLGATPQPSVYGHVSVQGRLNVDLYDFAKEIHEVKVKTLEEVADYLGVMKKEERVILEWWQIPEYWKDNEKRDVLLRYTRDDVISTYRLSGVFLPFGAQLSQISGLPLDQVMAASVGFRLEWRLLREAKKLGELAPNREERREESYTGAVVFKPEPGIHENVAVLDFASMYPNIMVKYNVGPDTLVRPGEDIDPDNVYTAPFVGHRFRKKPDGFFKRSVSKLLDIRRRIKQEMKRYDPDSPLYRLLNERQKAVKILANATYGYMGWTAARWYCRECAESITAWGRTIILKAAEQARKLGLKVIYGDTDSLFVTYDKEKTRKLIEYVENELGFEIKIDKIYKRVFFTEAKKRYAGLTVDNRIDIVGFEAIRGDWSELAKETQFKVIEIILRKGSIDEAIDYVRKVIQQLYDKKIDLRKLVIWKTITKRLSEYVADQPHVNVARILEKMGYRIVPGIKVGYVIVRGSGSLSKRARPYFLASIEDIDTEYYVDKQVVPAAMRILKYFGVRETQLKTGKKTRSLLDFF
ncbi:MAG: DNA polymerase II [Desulfurococcales archaeon]|nr:DNA polymerase II [Desulfurococcales archaeon]